MKGWRYKVRMFLTALFMGLGGILPAAGCTGGCGACFQCAGMGGIMAVLAAIGTARKKNHDAVAADHRSQPRGRIEKTVSGVAQQPAAK